MRPPQWWVTILRVGNFSMMPLQTRRVMANAVEYGPAQFGPGPVFGKFFAFVIRGGHFTGRMDEDRAVQFPPFFHTAAGIPVRREVCR